MDLLQQFFDVFLHIDTHLGTVIASYGALTYGILFLIIFCETGLVVTPFLPGDTLLFAAGALASKGDLHVGLLLLLLGIAGILGDAVNFAIGHYFGEAVYSWNSRFMKREHLLKTHQFFERYGSKTIVIARFMPIVRTLAPFVAGVGKMHYGHFAFYNILGGLLWVFLFIGGGYFFGSLPFVEENFGFVILAIIVLSVMPAIYHWLKEKGKGRSEE